MANFQPVFCFRKNKKKKILLHKDMKTVTVTCILCLVVIIKGQTDWKYYPSLSSIPDRRIHKVLYKVMPLSSQRKLRVSNSSWRLRTWIRRRLESGRLRLRECKIQSDRVRDKYRKARWLQKPMLYGFTDAEAANFVQRFDDDLSEPVQASCQKQTDGVRRKDVLDLYQNLKRTQCYVEGKKRRNDKNSTNKRQKRDVNGISNLDILENQKGNDFDNTSNMENKDTSPHRSRRSTELQTIQNIDGSVTRIRRCVRRGAVTRNGYVRMCSLCHAVTVLPENM